MTSIESLDLKTKGYTILRNRVPKKWLDTLSNAIDNSFIQHRNIQLSNNNEINSDGVALHAILDSKIFIEFLQVLLDNGFIDSLQNNFFKSNCILNSFSALNNLPFKPNFSSIIHRDLRFYSGDFPIMINCFLLSGSHLSEEKPSDSEFFSNSYQATGNRGDILIFNSNVWHSSSPNKTNKNRRAIPITISRSFMKQLLDYPRALGYDIMNTFTPKMQQFLGYSSRVPASLDEWYQPEENRFYKKNQD
jgi:hypothetical protein